MVPFERALVSSYKPSNPYILFLYQQLFARNFRLQFWVGVANPQFCGSGGRRGSGMVKKVKKRIALRGIPSHSYGTSLALWDHTVLPATRQVNAPRLHPSQ